MASTPSSMADTLIDDMSAGPGVHNLIDTLTKEIRIPVSEIVNEYSLVPPTDETPAYDAAIINDRNRTIQQIRTDVLIPFAGPDMMLHSEQQSFLISTWIEYMESKRRKEFAASLISPISKDDVLTTINFLQKDMSSFIEIGAHGVMALWMFLGHALRESTFTERCEQVYDVSATPLEAMNNANHHIGLFNDNRFPIPISKQSFENIHSRIALIRHYHFMPPPCTNLPHTQLALKIKENFSPNERLAAEAWNEQAKQYHLRVISSFKDDVSEARKSATKKEMEEGRMSDAHLRMIARNRAFAEYPLAQARKQFPWAFSRPTLSHVEASWKILCGGIDEWLKVGAPVCMMAWKNIHAHIHAHTNKDWDENVLDKATSLNECIQLAVDWVRRDGKKSASRIDLPPGIDLENLQVIEEKLEALKKYPFSVSGSAPGRNN